MREMFVFKRQPSGAAYAALLECALSFCDKGILVVSDSIELDPGGAQVLSELTPHMIKVERVAEWPGTSLLFGQRATLYTFRLCPDSVAILKRAAERLLAWDQPRLPQDLCFIRADGAPWLVTVTCQRKGYLCIDEQERNHILEKVASLQLRRYPYLLGTDAIVRAPGTKRYALQKEPRGAIYRSLVDVGAMLCERGVLSVEGRLNKRSERLMEMLQRSALKLETAAGWPGTRLYKGFEAKLLTFRLDEHSCGILKSAFKGLYGWSSLGRPHDLCFVKRDGVPWLVSKADRKAGYLFLRQAEKRDLLSAIPQLELAEAPVLAELFARPE